MEKDISLERITKKWEESTVEEKLEKIRKEIMALRYNTVSIQELRKDVEELMKHEHGNNGLPVISIKKNYGGSDLGLASRFDNLA